MDVQPSQIPKNTFLTKINLYICAVSLVKSLNLLVIISVLSQKGISTYFNKISLSPDTTPELYIMK